ncbi:MAG: sigma-70 family RNA polymerase sigma factor, partial [Chitinophagaceae bacterium]
DERWQQLVKQMEQLNLLDKALLMLYLDDKSYDEIADILGISASNVGTKLSRIKEKIRSQINSKQ